MNDSRDQTAYVEEPVSPGAARGRATPLVLGALGFVLFYLATDLATQGLANAPLPLPNAPAGEAYTWFVENRAAGFVLGLLQLLSVSALAVFVIRLRTAVRSPAQVSAADRARPFGLAAVALMAVSTLLSWVIAAFAPSMSADTVAAIRTAGFIAGGTAHVVALGLFVFLASRIPGLSRSVRVFGVVAVVPAVLSLVSLVVFQGAALILLGRLLCMIWIISATVSVTRRIVRRGVVS